ncbi:MAG: L,D-transpeptidase family protein [Methylacidiphilales bacterium]|nr:L,D-transpeptidase family protein [Candidatus Methylacidiphilales bacterium]
MPERRPPPVRLDSAAQTKTRPPSKSKSPRRPRSRKPRKESAAPYWIAGGLVVLLIALVVIYEEVPRIKAWFANREAPQKKIALMPAKPPVSSGQAEEEARARKLKEKAAEQARLLAEQPVPKPLPQPAPHTPPAAETQPPLVLPAPVIHGAPARAMPVDPNKLDTERIAAYQVALERILFSCGFIDGDQGMRTQRMLRAFQASHDLPVTGFLDQATRDAIGEPGEPFLSYVVTADDLASIMPKPLTWRAKSQVTRLGYNDIWEMLAEKFHCTRGYLKALNSGVTNLTAGTEVIGPKVFPAAPIPKAASLRILLSETSLEALDAGGKVIAFFPCSIARDKNKRPHGMLTVKVVDPNPDYTFDPALFADAAKAEGITHKMVLPPGPRNPVGTTWIGLSLPGYGIHGTPEPENISRTQSHGCFRLANWNAEKVLKMVRVGTPVDVEP